MMYFLTLPDGWKEINIDKNTMISEVEKYDTYRVKNGYGMGGYDKYLKSFIL